MKEIKTGLFLQHGDMIACGHCEPDKFSAVEPCRCLCHQKEEITKATEQTLDQYKDTFKALAEHDKSHPLEEGWRKGFDEKFPSLWDGNGENQAPWENTEEVKSFICQLLQERSKDRVGKMKKEIEGMKYSKEDVEMDRESYQYNRALSDVLQKLSEQLNQK